MNWNKINQEAQLDALVTESQEHPVLIFKHSTSCSISAMALSRMERKWNDAKAGDLKPYYLDLLANRSLSNEIASRFGVHHQSPQVLLISKGESVYDASHSEISFDEITEQVGAINV